MHYDVEGNLDINIKDFEEHIKQAEEKLKDFEKNFKKLAEIKSSNQMETLVETVQKIREELKGVKNEAGETKESLDSFAKSSKKNIGNATKEVNNLKEAVAETKAEVSTLDDSFTKSAEATDKLNREVKELKSDRIETIKSEMSQYSEKIKEAEKNLNAQIKTTQKLEKEANKLREKLDANPNNRWASKWETNLKNIEYQLKLSKEAEKYIQETIESFKLMVNVFKTELTDLEKSTDTTITRMVSKFKKAAMSWEQFKAGELYEKGIFFHEPVKVKDKYTGHGEYNQLFREQGYVEGEMKRIIREISALKNELNTPANISLFNELVSELDYFQKRWNELRKITDEERIISNKLSEPFDILANKLEKDINKVDTELVRLRSSYREHVREMNQLGQRIEGNKNGLAEGYTPSGMSVEEFERQIIEAEKKYERLSKIATSELEKINDKTKESIKLNRELLEAERQSSEIHVEESLPSKRIQAQSQEMRDEMDKTASSSKNLASEMKVSGMTIAEAYTYADKAVVARMNQIKRVLPEMEQTLANSRRAIKEVYAKRYSQSYTHLKSYDKKANWSMINSTERDLFHHQADLDYALKNYRKLKEEIISLKSELKSITPPKNTFEGMITNLVQLEHELELSKKRLKGFSDEAIKYEKLRNKALDKGEAGYHESFRRGYALDDFEDEMKYYKRLRSEISEIKGSLKEDFGIIFDDAAKSLDPQKLTSKLNESTESVIKALNRMRGRTRSIYSQMKEEFSQINSLRSEIKLQEELIRNGEERLERGWIRGNAKKDLLHTIESRKTIIKALKGEIDSLPNFLHGITSEFMSHHNKLLEGGNLKSVVGNVRELRAELKSLDSSYSSMFTDDQSVERLSAQLKHLKEESLKVKKEIKDGIGSLRLRRDNKGTDGLLGKEYEVYSQHVNALVKDYKKLQSQIDSIESQLSEQLSFVTEYEDGLGKLEKRLREIQEWNTMLWRAEELAPYYDMVQAITGATEEQLAVLQKGVMLAQELYSAENKYFDLSSPYSKETSMWINEQITDFNNLWRAYGKYHNELKEGRKVAVEYFQAMNGFQTRNKHATSNIPVGVAGTADFAKAIKWVEEYETRMKKLDSTFKSMSSFNFNEALGIDYINDAKLKNVEENIIRIKDTFATMNVNPLKEAVDSVNTAKLQDAVNHISQMNQRVREQNQSLKEQKLLMKEGVGGIGFAGTNEYNNMVSQLKAYEASANSAIRTSYRLEESMTSMGSASETAGSRVSTLGGILRTLRTTMSMIGGMFVWDFAFQILDATKATIAAKSEMESFFVTLKMGANDISHFNTMLDDTIRLFPKMNKFQLGETISSLGLEFNLNTDEMAQIAKVAPMIVNEYLRAGRKTEEAILAIKDISQGEFLRLSRETGVGKEELKAAGWNGDNKDILNLYEALEKVGKGRHWDAFASKATSINDVMLITENRMTEFATMISDWFTPVIVNCFNMLGSTFEGSRKWLENLSPLNQSIVTVTGAIVGMSAAAWGMESKVVPALKNVGSTILSNALGIDKAILQTYGLSSAIAQQTIVEKARNIAMAEGNVILDQKIRKGIAEAEASKLGMEATELQAVYEKIYADTLAVTRKEMALTDAETKSRKLTQEALLLAEKESITVEEAHALIMEREQIANMGALKSLVAYKLGLDMSIAANEGLVTAIGVKIGVMEVEETVTGTVTTLNWALLASYTALLVPLALVAAAVVLLVADFMDLCKSYDEFNDRLTNGAEKIDELKKKEEAYTATVNELENKTNRTSKETERLEEAREGLRYTTKALDRTEQEYYKSLAVSNYWEDTHTKTIGKRQEATEKRLKELAKDNKLSENTYLDEYNTSLTRAEQATYDATQAAAWRAENYKKELEEFSDPKLVAKFKNATDAYEEAKYKMSAPDSDMMTRAWSHVDTWSIGLQIEGIKFENDPEKWVNDFLTDNSSVFDRLREEMQRQSLTMNNPVIDVYEKMLKSSFDGMIKDWTEWGLSTNQWLDSIMPKFTVDGFKNWFGKNVREPFQKAFNDFMKNPLGNGGEEKAQSGTATKTLSLKTMFNFDFPSFKMDLIKGFTDTFSATTPIFQVANTTWKALGLGNGRSFTDSVKQGLGSLKDKMSIKLREGGNAIKTQASTWKTYAYNAGKGIYDRVKNGIGNIGTMIKNKLDEVTTKLKNIKDDWIGAAKEAASGLNPLNYVDVSLLTGGGLFGYAGGKGRANVKRSNKSLKISRPVYGASLSNASFEQTLGGLLTAQGFRRPSSYQYYPNSMKSVQETWDSGKSNCFDGAALILNLANMMGMKGHMVTGTWNGQGHAAAKIGGKLYDMTQFQKRGVFRGTSGVHFGGGSSGKHYGTSTNNVSRDMNITINLGGSTIYGMSDFKDKMEKVAEDVFIKYHDENPAIGV